MPDNNTTPQPRRRLTREEKEVQVIKAMLTRAAHDARDVKGAKP